YPLAIVESDGGAVIAKLQGSGGCVTEATVKEQLLYEVHDPTGYVTPDVTADFSRVAVREIGVHEVRVGNAGGNARPERLKVTVGYDGGFLAEAGISYAGPNAQARARLAKAILEERLREVHKCRDPVRVDLV